MTGRWESFLRRWVEAGLVSPEDAERIRASSRVFIWSWSGETALLDPSLAFFIPEHARDPSLRASGEELWAEITVPKKGPARPIRLDLRRRDDPTSAAKK
jgi:hypothetical protein